MYSVLVYVYVILVASIYNNFKADINEIGYEYTDCTQLTADRELCRPHVNTVMNRRVAEKARNF
jgi:hypothetical protein